MSNTIIRFRVHGSGFTVQGSRFTVHGSGVQGFKVNPDFIRIRLRIETLGHRLNRGILDT